MERHVLRRLTIVAAVAALAAVASAGAGRAQLPQPPSPSSVTSTVTQQTQPVTQTVTKQTQPVTQTVTQQTQPVTQTVTKQTQPVTVTQQTQPTPTVTQQPPPVTQQAQPVTQQAQPVVTQQAQTVTQQAHPVTSTASQSSGGQSGGSGGSSSGSGSTTTSSSSTGGTAARSPSSGGGGTSGGGTSGGGTSGGGGESRSFSSRASTSGSASGFSFSTSDWVGQGPPGGGLVVSPSRPVAVSRAGARIAQFRVLRPWLSLHPSLRRRGTTLVIVLSRPGPIRFILQQLSPQCRRVGTFTAPGHVGRNRIQLRARSRRILTPGTYKLVVRPLGAPPRVRGRSAKFVVVDDRRPRRELLAALDANACFGGSTLPPAGRLDERLGLEGDEAGGGGATTNGGDGGGAADGRRGAKGVVAASGDGLRAVGRLLPGGGVLGQTLSEVSDDHAWAFPILVTLVMLSVLLLGLAAVPAGVLAGTPVAAAVAYRRLELRIAGVAALVVAAAMYVALLLA